MKDHRRIIVPQHMRRQIFDQFHSSEEGGGHLNVNKITIESKRIYLERNDRRFHQMVHGVLPMSNQEEARKRSPLCAIQRNRCIRIHSASICVGHSLSLQEEISIILC